MGNSWNAHNSHDGKGWHRTNMEKGYKIKLYNTTELTGEEYDELRLRSLPLA